MMQRWYVTLHMDSSGTDGLSWITGRYVTFPTLGKAIDFARSLLVAWEKRSAKRRGLAIDPDAADVLPTAQPTFIFSRIGNEYRYKNAEVIR